MSEEVVLDSSAILASLNGEPGHDLVAGVVAESFVSAINFAEVVSKLVVAGMPEADAARAASRFGCQFVDTDEEQATTAAFIHAETRRAGVSIADSFCLALAKTRSSPVLTADRTWKQLGVGVEVRLIR